MVSDSYDNEYEDGSVPDEEEEKEKSHLEKTIMLSIFKL